MDHDHHHAVSDIPAGAETAKDPVCGMTVAVQPDTRHAEFQGETFHFCSEKCHPVTGLLLSPMIAAAAMSLSSVSVVTNALRLRRVDL